MIGAQLSSIGNRFAWLFLQSVLSTRCLTLRRRWVKVFRPLFKAGRPCVGRLNSAPAFQHHHAAANAGEQLRGDAGCNRAFCSTLVFKPALHARFRAYGSDT